MSDPNTTTATTSATAPAPTLVFEFHPLANIFPMLESKELAELANDIERRGLIEPIALYEGKILDGRNRYEAARLVKFKFTEGCFRSLPPGMDPKAFVIGANIHRRHLTPEKKRELLADLIKADPTKSNRQIAEQAKVSHHTVGDVRGELVATGQVAKLEAREGKDGKKRKVTSNTSVRNSDTYNKVEKKLIKKLQDLAPDVAHASATPDHQGVEGNSRDDEESG